MKKPTTTTQTWRNPFGASILFLMFLLNISLGTLQTANAQVSNYSFASSTSAYTPIVGTSMSLPTSAVEAWDSEFFFNSTAGVNGTLTQGTYNCFPIGFNFTYGSTVYDGFSIGVDGWIKLGATTGTALAAAGFGLPLSNTGINTAQLIAGLGIDLAGGIRAEGATTTGTNIYTLSGTGTGASSQIALGMRVVGANFATGTTIVAIAGNILTLSNATLATSPISKATFLNGGEISYITTGTTPSRTLTVQWKGVGRFDAYGDNFNFQIKLNETSNTIVFSYGTMTMSSTSIDTRTAQIGLKGTASPLNVNNRMGTGATAWTASAIGVTSTSTIDLQSATAPGGLIAPASGLTYTWTRPTFCSGTPATNSIVVPAAGACPNTPFYLTLSTFYPFSGITYQWQSSPTLTGTYTNVATNGNSAIYAATQTTATAYRCLVSCIGSPNAIIADVLVPMGAATNCYCYPQTTFVPAACINNVTLGTINNTSATCAAPYYTIFPNAVTTSLGTGVSYPINVVTSSSAVVSVWIDYNVNGVFDATEWTQVGTTGTNNIANILIPVGATIGQTKMRVRSRSDPNANAAGDACTAFSSGEAEDYIVNIVAGTACSGLPTANASLTTVSSVCVGTSFTLSLANFYNFSGLNYQWQSSATFAGTYTNIAAATNSRLTTTLTATTFYRCVISCGTPSPTTSTNATPVQVSLATGTGCYCIGAVSNGADTDIGNVTFGSLNNGIATPVTNNATAVNAYSNFTTIPAPNVAQNTTIALSLSQIASTSIFYEGLFAVYIDYNQNGILTDAGELVFSSTALTTALLPMQTANILIPSTALTGNTRMRVVLNEGGGVAPFPISPACGIAPSSYGEVEDYTINITGVSSCSGLSAGTNTIPSGVIGSAYNFVGTVTASPTTAINYTVSPPLTNGLVLDANTGIISATTLTGIANTTSYTITATQATPTGCPPNNRLVNIVIGANPCSGLSAGTNVVPAGVIGNTYNFVGTVTASPAAIINYTIMPALTNGLVLDANTGIISASVLTGVANTTSYTISAKQTTPTSCTAITRVISIVIASNPTTNVDNQLDNKVKVSPNPSNKDFRVDFSSLNVEKALVRVYDAQGKQIYSSEIKQNVSLITISLGKFANGIYLLEVETSKGRVLKRLIKEE